MSVALGELVYDVLSLYERSTSSVNIAITIIALPFLPFTTEPTIGSRMPVHFWNDLHDLHSCFQCSSSRKELEFIQLQKKNNQFSPGLPEEKHSAFSFAQLRDELK